MSGAIKFPLWLLLLLLLSSTSSPCFGSELDIQCLRSVQKSVVDPRGTLKSMWKFENNDDIYICTLGGVQCWNNGEENRVLSLHLYDLGLEGPFPKGLQDCTSINVLDLSGNKFSGPVPSDIGFQMPYLTSLDLSDNRLSGEIPESIGRMVYLNMLNLGYNQFSGRIPGQFITLSRLTTFSVADNFLSGHIPPFAEELNSPLNFAGNPGLCDAPLDDCPASRSRSRTRLMRITLRIMDDESSVGEAVGFVAGFVVAFSEKLRTCVFRM